MESIEQVSLANVMETCRACMSRGKKMHHIFNEAIGMDGVVDKLQFSTGILVDPNDGLPPQICNDCLENLNTAHKFKTTCLTSQETFQHLLLKAKIKSEAMDINLDFDVSGFDDGEFDESKLNIKTEVLDALVNNSVMVAKSGRKKRKMSVEESLKQKISKVEKPAGKKRGKYKQKDSTGPVKRIRNKVPKFRQLYCEACDIKFTCKEESDRHKKLAHPETDSWICEICGKKLTRNALKLHRRTHFPPEYECAHCDYKTWGKNDLVKHMKIHSVDYSAEESVDKVKSCFFFLFFNALWPVITKICGKQFVHRGSHFAHVRSHFPPQYSCAHCVYTAWNKSDLVKHVMIHTGIKQYRCEYCPAAYYNSSNLRSHIKRKHEGIKRFFCTMCDAKFFENSKLQRHLDSHNDIKRYDCEVCHSRFSRRCYWKKHLKQHHNIDIPTPRPGKKRNFLIEQHGDQAHEQIPSQLYIKPSVL